MDYEKEFPNAYRQAEITGPVKRTLETYQQALERFQTNKSALYDAETGAQIYSDTEHEKRWQEALKPLHAAAAKARELARELETEARELEIADAGGDIMDGLDDATIVRANARQPFVKEEVESLSPQSNLVRRLKQVKQRGDAAELFLYARYARGRLDDFRANERLELMELLDAMEKKLQPQDSPRAKAAQKRMQARALSDATRDLFRVDGSFERAKQEARASGMFGF